MPADAAAGAPPASSAREAGIETVYQTLALSLMEMDAVGELGPTAQFMAELESQGRLDRVVEGLPDAAGIAERAQAVGLAQAGVGRARDEQVDALLGGHRLEPAREVRRVADGGVLDAPLGADVAGHHVAGVEPDAHGQRLAEPALDQPSVEAR